MSATVAASPAAPRPRLGWLALTAMAAAAVLGGGALSTTRESVATAAAATSAARAATDVSIAEEGVMTAHSHAHLATLDARFEHRPTAPALEAQEAGLARDEAAGMRALRRASTRLDALRFDRRFALERVRDDLTAGAGLFAAVALAAGFAALRPAPARWAGYAVATGVLAWGAWASAARVWDKIG